MNATDAKIDKLLSGLASEYPALKETNDNKGGGKAGGKSKGKGKNGSAEGGWYCANKECVAHHYNPTTWACRLCKTPREQGSTPLTSEAQQQDKGGQGKGKGEQQKGKGKGGGKKGPEHPDGAPATGAGAPAEATKGPSQTNNPKDHKELMQYLSTFCPDEEESSDHDSDGFPWGDMDDEDELLTNEEQAARSKEQDELRSFIAVLEAMPQTEVIQQTLNEKRKLVTKVKVAPIDTAALSTLAYADQKAKILTMEAHWTRMHAARKEKQERNVEQAQLRVAKAQTNYDMQLKARQEQWEEEQEFKKKMAEVRAKHLIDEDATSFVNLEVKGKTAKPQEPSAAKLAEILTEGMNDVQPNQEIIDLGLSQETMCSVVKFYAKNILEKQALKMPSQYVPAEA